MSQVFRHRTEHISVASAPLTRAQRAAMRVEYLALRGHDPRVLQLLDEVEQLETHVRELSAQLDSQESRLRRSSARPQHQPDSAAYPTGDGAVSA